MMLSLLSWIAAAPALSAEPVELLRTGIFHGSEVSFEAEGEWFGLYETADGMALERTWVRILAAPDPLLDMPGETTARRVVVEGDAEPLVLIRGLPGLAEGPVETSYLGPDAVEVGGTRSLSEGPEGWYALAAFGTAEPASDLYFPARVSDYELRLYRHPPLELWASAPPQSQPLLRAERLEDSQPQLIWVGDLDRDGEPDLLLDATSHYNVSDYTLWTSRGAPEGSLVQQVARFAVSGC